MLNDKLQKLMIEAGDKSGATSIRVIEAAGLNPQEAIVAITISQKVFSLGMNGALACMAAGIDLKRIQVEAGINSAFEAIKEANFQEKITTIIAVAKEEK